MRRCCIKNCKNSDRLGLSLMLIPKDPSRRALWLSKIGSALDTRISLKVVCEAHFKEDDWCRGRLKYTAFPSIFCSCSPKSSTKQDSTDNTQKISKDHDYSSQNVLTTEPVPITVPSEACCSTPDHTYSLVNPKLNLEVKEVVLEKDNATIKGATNAEKELSRKRRMHSKTCPMFAAVFKSFRVLSEESQNHSQKTTQLSGSASTTCASEAPVLNSSKPLLASPSSSLQPSSAQPLGSSNLSAAPKSHGETLVLRSVVPSALVKTHASASSMGEIIGNVDIKALKTPDGAKGLQTGNEVPGIIVRRGADILLVPVTSLSECLL